MNPEYQAPATARIRAFFLARARHLSATRPSPRPDVPVVPSITPLHAWEVSTDDCDEPTLFQSLSEARRHARDYSCGSDTGYAIWTGYMENGEFVPTRRVEWYEPHPDDFAPQDDSPSLDDHPWSITQRGERG